MGRNLKSFGMSTVLGALAAFTLLGSIAQAADTVRHGVQIGALGSLRMTLPTVAGKYDLQYDIKDFRDSTSVLLAIDQGELEIGNTTAQHLIRAINEGIDVVMVAGWGGGYNVLVAGKSLDVAAGDWNALRDVVARRKGEGKPLSIGVPTGSMQHAKLSYALKNAGIDADKDVRIVNIPFPTHPRALEAGEVDMAMTLAVFGALAINKGDAKFFHHVVDTRSGRQEIGFIVARKLIQSNRDLVQRIVSSHVEAMNQFVGNTKKQIELEAQYTKLPLPVVEMQQE